MATHSQTGDHIYTASYDADACGSGNGAHASTPDGVVSGASFRRASCLAPG